MSGAAKNDRRIALLLGAIAGLIVVVVKAFLGVRWGLPSELAPDALDSFGIMHTVQDSLSYLSWVQQARLGECFFTDLYTTEPHDAVFVQPYLCAVGSVSRLLGVDGVLGFNLSGLVAAMVLAPAVYYLGRSSGLSTRWSVAASAVTFFGGGASWTSAPSGVDSEYFDLFPSIALHMYPYHAAGLALLTLLAIAALRVEQVPGELRTRALLVVAAVAFLLSWVRPYEPIAFTLAAGLYAVVRLARSDGRDRRWVVTTIILAAAIAPSVAYANWISNQPVWSDFARLSIVAPRERIAWLVGFGPLWVLAAPAVVVTLRKQEAAAVFAAWTVLLFTMLVVVSVPFSKLAAGCFVALSILVARSGQAVVELPKGSRRALAIAGVVAFAMVSLIGALTQLASLRPRIPRVDGELLAVAKSIREQAPTGAPLVLTDPQTGNLLPGLFGFRVYSGHWSLTIDRPTKNAQLNAAGIVFDPRRSTGSEAELPARITDLVKAISPDLVLLRRNAPAVVVLRASNLNVVHEGGNWVLFQGRPAVDATEMK